MQDGTRREFFQAGAGAAAGVTLGGAAGELRKLSENLFVLEDTCHVYVVRDGTRALLIDFGSGKVLEHLPSLGVITVDWILHTHHHRDQCQGDQKAVARKIPIAVPQHERDLFADAENFWRNRRIFHLYYVRNNFRTVTKNIPVDRLLADYSTFVWRDKYEISVVPTPGHTLGSITLLMTVDGRRVAFTGDLFYAPGKLQTLYDTQNGYGGSEGVDLTVYSLSQLREQRPAWILPSHGEFMMDADGAIGRTMTKLSAYYTFQSGNPTSITAKPYAVSPHLIAHYRTESSFYCIVSDSGRAMFVDYGSASPNHFWNFQLATETTDRIRFVEHGIGELQREFGVKSVDVAMPSHMHDDHINGFPHLVRRYGTKVWCYENMVDILQNPRGQNLGCILAERTPVARTFRDGEKFRWEEFEFEVTHSPGHTEYQMALFVTIDGKRVAFTGDAFFADEKKEGVLRHNIIWRNHVENDSHLKSIRNLMAHEPEVLCPGHGRPYAVDKTIMEATGRKFRRQQEWFFDVLPGDPDFGMDPSWCSVYPYQMVIAPGERRRVEVRVQNYKASEMKLEAALVCPPEWRVQPDVVKVTVPGRGKAHGTAWVEIPRSYQPPLPRVAIALDVMADGKYLGQITEAVVDFHEDHGY